MADFGWELVPKDRAMTLRHLASMTSGYARPEEPGKAWAYNDYAIQLYQKTLFDKIFQGKPEEVFHDPRPIWRAGAAGWLCISQDESADERVGPRFCPRGLVLAQPRQLERQATAAAGLF